eukprot:82385-Pyramimonas_sp.AAC.1
MEHRAALETDVDAVGDAGCSSTTSRGGSWPELSESEVSGERGDDPAGDGWERGLAVASSEDLAVGHGDEQENCSAAS